MKFANFLETPSFIEHLWSLLLNKPRRSLWFSGKGIFWSFSISLPWLSNIISNLWTKSSFDISFYSSWSTQPFRLYCGLWICHTTMTHFVYTWIYKNDWFQKKAAFVRSEKVEMISTFQRKVSKKPKTFMHVLEQKKNKKKRCRRDIPLIFRLV